MTQRADNYEFHVLMSKSRALPGVAEAGLLPEHMDQVRELIAKGELDYQKADGKGRTLWAVMDKFVEIPAQKIEIIKMMMEQGGNPLLASDQEIETLSAHQWVRRSFEDILVDKEITGERLRDSLGGNYYHVMARRSPWSLADLLERMEDVQRDQHEESSGQQRVRRGWIKAVDHSGNTPLHVLWSPETYENILKTNKPELVRRADDNFNYWSLGITSRMMALGADTLAANHQGQTPWSLMAGRNIELMKNANQFGWGEIRADAEQRLLSRGTPQATEGRKKGLRL